MFTPEVLEVIKIGFNYGVPTGLLLILVVALWLAARWLKAEVVKPLVASHLSLVSALQDAVPRQTEQLQAQTGLMKSQINQMDGLRALTADANKLLKDNADFAKVSADRIERAVQVACRHSPPVIITAPVVAPE